MFVCSDVVNVCRFACLICLSLCLFAVCFSVNFSTFSFHLVTFQFWLYMLDICKVLLQLCQNIKTLLCNSLVCCTPTRDNVGWRVGKRATETEITIFFCSPFHCFTAYTWVGFFSIVRQKHFKLIRKHSFLW